MKYMGSKSKYASEILPIILAHRSVGQWYVEPFLGGGNTFYLVDGKKMGNDTNKYVVAMIKAVGEGWVPPYDVSEHEYNVAKLLPEHMGDETIGFIGIGCSYGGKWFGGYARGNNQTGIPRNYAEESAKNILKQQDGFKDAIYTSLSYDKMDIPANSIIYCDPPYANSTKYNREFDSESFWNWCNGMVDIGHTVYVSEYNAPDGWRCVWKKEVNSSLTKDTGSKKAVEKLFTKEPSDV